MQISRYILAHPFRLAILMLMALTVSSCSDITETPDNGEPRGGYITLNLSCTSLRSRADENGVASLNENLIKNATIYLFPAYACGDNDKPLMSVPLDFGTGINNSVTAEVNFTRELFDRLYTPDGVTKYSTAFVFAIVNMGANAPSGTDLTLGELKAQAVTTQSLSDILTAQESFVMSGSADVNINFATDMIHSTITGDVSLTRAASKMRLAVKVADSVTDANGVIWKPAPDKMIVYLNNGVNKTLIAAPYTPADEDYFDVEGNDASGFTKSDNTEETYPWKVNHPFYSYKNSWATDNSKMTYFTLIVPWQKDDETQATRNCYYMVPVVRENALTPNVSYQVNINVGILGSFTLDEELPLDDCSFRAVNWRDEEIGVDIADYRYLVLEQSNYTINNETSNTISFYSSHETVVKDIEVTYNRYNFSNTGLEQTITMSTNQVKNSVATVNGTEVKMLTADINNTVDPETMTRTLNFYHTLDQWYPAEADGTRIWLGPDEAGNYPTETLQSLLDKINKYLPVEPQAAAYSIYNIKLTIVHADKIGKVDESNYTETINITQYPAMYIQAETNTYTVSALGLPFGAASYGNIYYNGVTRNITSQRPGWSMVPWGLIGSNRNPNMYIITISQLSANESQYIIGDPRNESINVPAYNTTEDQPTTLWTSADALYGDSPRRLQYYYPADASDAKKNYIAPKFRVASSYSVGETVKLDSILIRCASYQELKYPAGRWRLPTYAEFEYILTLSNQGKIPELYTRDVTYWTADGPYLGELGADGHLQASTRTTGTARCIYDEWYWEGSTVEANGTTEPWISGGKTFIATRYPFTWGDAPR